MFYKKNITLHQKAKPIKLECTKEDNGQLAVAFVLSCFTHYSIDKFIKDEI